MSARTRWITFDCYGTLIDWQSGFTAVLRSLAGDRASDVLRSYHQHERTVESERPHRSYKEVLVSSLVRAAAECGVSLSPSAARALPDAWSMLRPFDDAERMLEELRQDGWRLAVLTNCDDDLFSVTHRMFREPFDLVLTAERVRGYKPAPWHFRGFELVTRVDRRHWVHVANSWYHDIAPAQSLGVRHVWLDRDRTGQESPSATVRVHGAAEVRQVVSTLVDEAWCPRTPAFC